MWSSDFKFICSSLTFKRLFTAQTVSAPGVFCAGGAVAVTRTTWDDVKYAVLRWAKIATAFVARSGYYFVSSLVALSEEREAFLWTMTFFPQILRLWLMASDCSQSILWTLTKSTADLEKLSKVGLPTKSEILSLTGHRTLSIDSVDQFEYREPVFSADGGVQLVRRINSARPHPQPLILLW